MATTVKGGTFLQTAFGENPSNLRLSNLPFMYGIVGRTDDKPYETMLMRHFKPPGATTRTASAPRPVLGQIDHRDVRRIKEYQAEMNHAFRPHRPVLAPRTPAWTGLVTNMKTHADERLLSLDTIHKESFPALNIPVFRARGPAAGLKLNLEKGKLPDSLHKASFVPHKVSPFVQPESKHLGGAPPYKGDNKGFRSNSSYSDDFQYRWCSPTQSTKKHSPLVMGDKEKIAEKETTHSAAYAYTGPPSPVSQMKRLSIKLGDDRDRKWTTTTSDTFTEIKLDGGRPKPIGRTHTSIPEGDTDERRNRERRTFTTNHFFFSEEKHKQVAVHVDGPSLMTKSNVQFGKDGSEKMAFSTTTQETFAPKPLAPAKLQRFPPGRVLGDQEPSPAVSTVQMDYTPPNRGKQDLNPRQLHQIKASHIKLPYNELFFTTTQKEDFVPKPISRVTLDKTTPRQLISHVRL